MMQIPFSLSRIIGTLWLVLTGLSFSLALTIFPALPAWAESEQALGEMKTDAMIIVKRFGGTLKPQLKKALQGGGPLQAIEVCSQRAPEIAQQLSAETGWSVKRISLKPRNHNSAQPDAWETKILEQFNRRQRAGEAVTDISHAEVVSGQFRFMKAQGVAPICLTCHGQQLAPEVKRALERYYPKDSATGYSLGQIRGAFSLSKQL